MNDKFYMKVVNHHNIVQNKIKDEGSIVLMTVAVGSQNYGLDTPQSDCDTFSFILPDFLSFIRGDAPKSYEFEVEDGKCCVKDMRLALNLLRKPSPNSVECFVGQYKVYRKIYIPIFEKWLNENLSFPYDTNSSLFYLTHSNYKHMLDAIMGTIKGLEGRNMSYGKKASHLLRLTSLFYRYLDDSLLPHQYLIMDSMTKDIALDMKLNGITKENYEQLKETYYKKLKEKYDTIDFNNFIYKHYEERGKDMIDFFQKDLTKIYLGEHGYESYST